MNYILYEAQEVHNQLFKMERNFMLQTLSPHIMFT